ncbi:MAG: hypothetical protein L6Q83_06315, partial [Gammaproteobacteria bacterium]|nr:hypothetical protein [Gammaproteobacteria bacterium]
MNTKTVGSPGPSSNLALWLLNKKTWFTQFMIVTAISVAGLVFLGQQTYSGSPPLVDMVTPDGRTLITRAEIERGKEIFHL